MSSARAKAAKSEACGEEPPAGDGLAWRPAAGQVVDGQNLPSPMLALVNLLATAFMTGLIWFVQIVHYPLFAKVGRDGFAAYESSHARLTTLVVGPVMLLEALTALLLVLAPPPGAPRWLLWAGLALVGAIWLATALCSVPRHATLRLGFDERAHAALVSTNWLRTVGWSARSAIMAWVVARC